MCVHMRSCVRRGNCTEITDKCTFTETMRDGQKRRTFGTTNFFFYLPSGTL